MARKLYYKIGEACKKLDIQPYVLRYWETEFAMLSPDKSKSGQRVYSAKDLQLIQRIKELLYEEGYTIAGAKKKLEAEMAGAPAKATPAKAGAPKQEAPKKTSTKRAARKASAAKSAAAGAGELDTASVQRIETLRKGIRKLLGEAREILDRLEPPTAS